MNDTTKGAITTKGFYFRFERGQWTKCVYNDQVSPIVHHQPRSGVTYDGALTEDQLRHLDALISHYLRSIGHNG